MQRCLDDRQVRALRFETPYQINITLFAARIVCPIAKNLVRAQQTATAGLTNLQAVQSAFQKSG